MANRNYYQRRRQGNGKKVVAGIVAFVLTGAVVAGVVGYGSNWYRDMSFSKWFGSNQEQEQTDPETQEVGGEALITETNESGGISLMSTTIDPSEYEAAGVAEDAVTAYTIKATIEPAEALQVFYWSYDWEIYTSTWATGKTVSDYVTMTISEDQSTATISCLQAFGEPIIIKAMHDSFRNTISASCKVDYLRPIQKIVYDNNNNYTAPYVNGFEGESVSKTGTVTYGLGTISGDLTIPNTRLYLNSSYLMKDSYENWYWGEFKYNYLNEYNHVHFATTMSTGPELTSYEFELGELSIANDTATRTLAINNINIGLKQITAFTEYTNAAGETITPTYDNFEGSDYLKYAVTFQSTITSSYIVRNRISYIFNNKNYGNIDTTMYFRQSQTETPLPADPSGISLDQNNIVFGI